MNGDAPETALLEGDERVADLYKDDVPETTMFRPLRDMVLARYIEEDQNRKVGELFMPQSKKSRDKLFVRAEVIAHGPKCDAAKIGTVIFVGEHHGDYYVINGKRCVLIRERDISGVVTDA